MMFVRPNVYRPAMKTVFPVAGRFNPPPILQEEFVLLTLSLIFVSSPPPTDLALVKNPKAKPDVTYGLTFELPNWTFSITGMST